MPKLGISKAGRLAVLATDAATAVYTVYRTSLTARQPQWLAVPMLPTLYEEKETSEDDKHHADRMSSVSNFLAFSALWGAVLWSESSTRACSCLSAQEKSQGFEMSQEVWQVEQP